MACTGRTTVTRSENFLARMWTVTGRGFHRSRTPLACRLCKPSLRTPIARSPYRDQLVGLCKAGFSSDCMNVTIPYDGDARLDAVENGSFTNSVWCIDVATNAVRRSRFHRMFFLLLRLEVGEDNKGWRLLGPGGCAQVVPDSGGIIV